MYKIAVIGDRDSVLGFRALGLDVFPTEDTDAGRRTLHRLAQEDYAVIYITEQLAQQLTAEIARYKDAPLPAVILIPGKTGSLGIAGAALHDAVAYGVNLFHRVDHLVLALAQNVLHFVKSIRMGRQLLVVLKLLSIHFDRHILLAAVDGHTDPLNDAFTQHGQIAHIHQLIF